MPRSLTRPWCLTILPVGVVLAALNPAATRPTCAAAPIPAVHADQTGWPEWLRQILCHLYQAWGGDCNDLGQTPAGAVAEVLTVYESKGAPAFANQAEIDAFLADLDALEDHLNSAENNLSGPDTTALRDMIAGLRETLGA